MVSLIKGHVYVTTCNSLLSKKIDIICLAWDAHKNRALVLGIDPSYIYNLFVNISNPMHGIYDNRYTLVTNVSCQLEGIPHKQT